MATPASQWMQVSAGPLAGHWLLLPASGAYHEMVGGRYEAFLFEVLGQFKSLTSLTVWDVGAHIGYHALTFAALVGPSGHVVAFEPNTFNAARIEQNLERNPELAGRTTLMKCALSDHDGEASFVFSPQVDIGWSSGSHLEGALVAEDQAAYAAFEQTVVTTAKADTLLAAGRVPTPAIIKIDVEGAELLVLEGSLETLAVARPALLIEVHSIATMFHLQGLLNRFNYEIAIVEEETGLTSRCHIFARSVSDQ